MPDITFYHSDLTNSRDLISKLNQLAQAPVGTPNVSVVTCLYQDTTPAAITNLSTDYSEIVNLLDSNKEVFIKMYLSNTGVTAPSVWFTTASVERNSGVERVIFTSQIYEDASGDYKQLYCYKIILTQTSKRVERIILNDTVLYGGTLTSNNDNYSVSTNLNYQLTQEHLQDSVIPVLNLNISGTYHLYSLHALYTGSCVFKNIVISEPSIVQNTVTFYENGDPATYESVAIVFGLDVSDIKLTYSELTTLISQNGLEINRYYVITDYVTKTKGTDGAAQMSAEHPFQLKVKASSENTLFPEAHALPYIQNPSYFANCEITKWQLLYDVNNDDTKYEWADTTTGKGVIYYMKDEFGNECDYDFKNVLFKRSDAQVRFDDDNITVTNVDKAAWGSNSNIVVPANADYYYVYTFTTNIFDRGDGTVVGDTCKFKNNVIKSKLGKLPNIVFYNPGDNPVVNNTIKESEKMTFMCSAQNNTIDTSSELLFYYYISSEVIDSNIIGFSNNNVSYSEFCFNKISHATNNRFKQVFQYNIIKGPFNNNKLGNYILNNTFGHSFSNNKIRSYLRYSTFENYISGCTFNTVGTSGNYIQYLHVLSGVSGTFNSSSYSATNYDKIISKTSNGTTKVYTLADLIL